MKRTRAAVERLKRGQREAREDRRWRARCYYEERAYDFLYGALTSIPMDVERPGGRGDVRGITVGKVSRR